MKTIYRINEVRNGNFEFSCPGCVVTATNPDECNFIRECIRYAKSHDCDVVGYVTYMLEKEGIEI